MSAFITDEDLEIFVRDVLQEEPRRKETALRISDAIAEQREYEARARCECAVNCCECIVAAPTRPTEIEAGDTFEQLAPNGQRLTLGALGVRRSPAGEIFEIFTAGWPPAIVRIPEHGTVTLVRKGTGLSKEELRHRRRSFGGSWEDGR